jgi:glycosyltransferase involved in cell wall biosynthesis
VSVVVTLYNYEHHIREALRSVAISDDADYEVIVVDDASSDGSLATTRAALEEIPWLPAKVISRARNGGLAAARNLGIAESRAPYVFILDADNAIYPHALTRLADALDRDPGAAFAYGIIAQQAPTGPYGLLSWHRWSAHRLAHGNFVDAMAMLRRSEVLAAGGYASDPRLHGWEDFALCCEFAERGQRGLLLPEIVARYRVSPHSMISVTNIDTAEAWAALAARYPVTTAALGEEPEGSGISELPPLPVATRS